MTIKETWFYTWEDRRDPDGYGFVKNVATGQIYGSPVASNDTTLRIKFACLFVFQALFSPFRLSYRVLSLCAFDFAVAGYRSAKVEWLNERQTCQMAQQEEYLKSKTITQLPPTASAFYWKAAKNISCQLILNVFKIATYALAVVALQFAALYGIFKPLDGRGFYSLIEEIAAKRDPYDLPILLISNYSAPCMQPKSVWEQQNWFTWFPNYNPDSYYSLLLRVKRCIETQALSLEQEGIKKTDYIKLLNQACDKQKIHKDNQQIINIFKGMNSLLEEIPQGRESIVQAMEKGHDIEDLVSLHQGKKGNLLQLFTQLDTELQKTS